MPRGKKKTKSVEKATETGKVRLKKDGTPAKKPGPKPGMSRKASSKTRAGSASTGGKSGGAIKHKTAQVKNVEGMERLEGLYNHLNVLVPHVPTLASHGESTVIRDEIFKTVLQLAKTREDVFGAVGETLEEAQDRANQAASEAEKLRARVSELEDELKAIEEDSEDEEESEDRSMRSAQPFNPPAFPS